MISVMIATYNRAQMLGRTLDSFSRLEIPRGIEIELIIVPNGCDDLTMEIIQEKTGKIPCEVRIFQQAEANLNRARNCGLSEARGEILVFLDDDVMVSRGWLKGMMEVYDRCKADLIAGKVTLWWEDGQAPDWSSRGVERLLSRLDFGNEILPLNKPGQMVGANFSFTRQVMDRIGNFSPGLDRAGESLLSGGDSEFVRRALAAGFKLFYAPRMSVEHCIPKHRATIEYLSRLATSRGMTQVALAARNGSFKRLRSLRGGASQFLIGGLKEAFYTLIGRRKDSVSARLLRMRGFGVLIATFRIRT